ncbi:MAG: hypothetical protein NUV76_03995 [Candidatus Kuenenia sp.]|nr:hypothetical protein [Candidatus Kuenenia sp.]
MITQEISQTLSGISHAPGNKLEFRVSLESYKEEENDQIRGNGSFKKAIGGIQSLVNAGFNPIITITD